MQEVTRRDPHQQRLARLHWELEQRRNQTNLSEQLSSEQQAVLHNITDLNTRLSSLRPRIKDVLQVFDLNNVLHYISNDHC